MDEVTGQRELGAAAEGRTIDRGDHRNRAVHQGIEGLFEQHMLGPPGRIGHPVALLQIPAGAEGGLAGSGEDHAAQVARLEQQALKQRQDIPRHLRIERVAHIRAIEGDPQDVGRGGIEQQGFVGHGELLQTLLPLAGRRWPPQGVG